MSVPGVPADAVLVARVIGAWGIRGWIRLKPYSREAVALQSARAWWISQGPSGAHVATVLAAKTHGDAVVAQIDGIATRSQAEALKGVDVYIERSAFPPTEQGEYYWVDLIGADVVTEEGAAMGRVEDVMESGAHAILAVVDRSDGGAPTQALIPFVDAHVKHVDLATKRIVVQWLPPV